MPGRAFATRGSGPRSVPERAQTTSSGSTGVARSTTGRCRTASARAASTSHTPVGPDWKLAGAGDVDGDGTDDIVWQHWSGQVHYWPMQNGQRRAASTCHPDRRGLETRGRRRRRRRRHRRHRLAALERPGPLLADAERPAPGGINMHTPVGPDWNSWARATWTVTAPTTSSGSTGNGQVHYWPMQNGQRRAASTCHPGRPGLETRGRGRHGRRRHRRRRLAALERPGPLLADAQRSAPGGINVHTPVGPDWKLAGVGDVD